MTMSINIPVRSRWDVIGKLMVQLPDRYLQATTLFPPEDQVEFYKKAVKDFPVKIVACPNDMLLARKRQHIGNLSIAAGEPYHLQMDDDVRFEVRKSPETHQTKKCVPDEVGEMLDWVEEKLKTGTWSHVGVSPRYMNNTAFPIGGPETCIRECTRIMCVFGWRNEDFAQIDYARSILRSDLESTLQSLRKGRPNLCVGYWCHSQLSGAPGGCADYRDVELSDQAAYRLKELHPGLVSIVQKHNKTGFMKDRLEVQIHWKKALGWDARNA